MDVCPFLIRMCSCDDVCSGNYNWIAFPQSYDWYVNSDKHIAHVMLYVVNHGV
jgi:hypothetical protein